jgi:hypothetical protein
LEVRRLHTEDPEIVDLANALRQPVWAEGRRLAHALVERRRARLDRQRFARDLT